MISQIRSITIRVINTDDFLRFIPGYQFVPYTQCTICYTDCNGHSDYVVGRADGIDHLAALEAERQAWDALAHLVSLAVREAEDRALINEGAGALHIA
jgi:hypothetical protein